MDFIILMLILSGLVLISAAMHGNSIPATIQGLIGGGPTSGKQ